MNIEYLSYLNIITFCLISALTIVINIKIFSKTESDNTNWLFFYILYFPILYIFIFFRPLITTTTLTTSQILSGIEFNFFNTIANDWNESIIAVQKGNEKILVNFFIHYIGNFLIYMPLADYIYSVKTKYNRRQTLVTATFIIIFVEIYQLLISIIMQKLVYKITLADIFIPIFGISLFLLITLLIEKYFNTNNASIII